MRCFYDLEFLEDGQTIQLISIGIVCEDGCRYYAVNSDMPVEEIQRRQWLMVNVVPQLPLRNHSKSTFGDNAAPHGRFALETRDTRVKPRWVIANEVRDFLLDPTAREPGDQIELWADYGAYDHVALMQLWGAMVDRPAQLPMWTHDLRQEAERLGVSTAALDDIPRTGPAHDALADAEHLHRQWAWLQDREKSRANLQRAATRPR